MEGTRKRPWSDLPPELLSMIGTRLHTRMDVLRFRSVCSSFRSSIPRPAPRFPFRIPHGPVCGVFLRESTVYTVDKPADGAASGRVRWLLKLEEPELGDTWIRRPIISLPHKFPGVLDCLQFRITEIGREYTLEHGWETGSHVRGIKKVVVHPDCVWTDLHQCVVYFIDQNHLWYWKYGDEAWSHLGWGYDDIAVYQGKVCIVHKSGVASWIDSSFKRRRFSPSIDGDSRGDKKRLVVSSGDLYVVDVRFIRLGEIMRTPDFRVYRLDRQCGRWEEVRSLGNSVFFLCKFCSFAVPAGELDQYKGDCIYYAKRAFFDGSWDHETVFSLADRGRDDLYVSEEA